MHYKFPLYACAINGLIVTILGAFGAHWAKYYIPSLFFHSYETAVSYHYFYTLALGFIGCLMFNLDNKWLYRCYLLFLAGIILFSGSLYILALSQIKLLGMITPIGGLCFIIGWISLFISVAQIKNNA